MDATILITGGAGFIGTHTAALLTERGDRVRVLDNLSPQVHGAAAVRPRRLPAGVEFLAGDVRDRGAVREALHGVDAVIHLASLTGVTQSMYDVKDYMDVNVSGTACLWDVIVNEGLRLRKFVLASSRAVYGEGAHACPACGLAGSPPPRESEQLLQGRWDLECPGCGDPMRAVATAEASPLGPLSVYATTKAFQEQLCRQMAAASGTPQVTLRYFNVYGPHQSLSNPYTGIAPAFCTRLREGKPVALYEDGLPLRDFVHVEDVARANLLALDLACDGAAVFNVGTGRPATIAEIARAIAGALGVEGRFEVSGQYRVGDIRSCYADPARSARELGFVARWGLDEGIADLIAWVVEQAPEATGFEEAVNDLIGRGLIHTARTGASPARTA